MTKTTHARIAAAGLLLGPLLFTLADLFRRLVEPSGTPTAAQITRAVSQHEATWLAAGLLSMIAAPCFVAGVVGLAVAVGGRGGRLTAVGAALVGFGSIASVAHAVAFFSPYALYDRAGTSSTAMTALDDASESYPLLVAVIVVFLVGMMLGSIILLIGLRRARRVPLWSVVAVIVFVACGSTGGVGPGVLGIVAALLAFAPAARSLLVEPSLAAPDGVPQVVPA
jgi:hypothetical protein